MTHLRSAFRREETLQSEKTTRHRMHWRHTDNKWDVVSETLDWNNATHPEEHSAFSETQVWAQSDFTRHTPETPSEWETFTTEETHTPMIVDEYAHSQLVQQLTENVNHLNAQEVAEFLHDTFTVEYDVDLGEKDCNECEGSGVVNRSGMTVDCNNCGGNGAIDQGMLRRTFPYVRDRIISEKPNQSELQAIQFTINKMANGNEQKQRPVSPHEVLQLFDLLENDKNEALIEQALSYIEPALPTRERPVRENGKIVTDENFNPVMENVVDEKAREKAAVKLRSALLDVSLNKAKQAVTA